MPLVQVTIMQGRSQEQKEAFFEEVTQSAMKHLDVKREQVRVLINEIPAEHWSIGGQSVAKIRSESESS